MTDTTKTDKKPRKPNFVKRDVVLKGKTKFTNLSKPDEQFAIFQLVMTVDENDPQIDMMQKLYAEAIAFERAQIVKAKQGSFVDGPLTAVQQDFDKEGNETGLFTIKARRKEIMGAPGVYSSGGEKVDKNIIERGSDVEVQVTVKSYVMGSTLGMSLQLENVKIVREEPSSFVPNSGPREAVFTFTPSVSMDSLESPF